MLQVLRAVIDKSGERCVAIHNERLFCERLVAAPEAVHRDSEAGRAKTILVTGGCKGLGLEYTKQVSSVTSCPPIPVTTLQTHADIAFDTPLCIILSVKTC